ncbi:MAG: hypothetical protein ABI999_00020 [Acidobacteriota bacterium]
MKRTQFFAVIFVVVVAALSVSAQRVRCEPQDGVAVTNVYVVDSGKVVTEVHPGSNGGNGYQINIMGTNVDKLTVLQDPFMTSIGVISNYTGPTSAKWSVTFGANMARTIRGVRMTNACTGQTSSYKFDTAIRLLDR